MAIERTGPDASGVTYLSVSGPFHLSDLRGTLIELYAEHPPELMKRILWDLRGVDVDWGTDELRRFAEWVKENRQPGRGKTAVVVERDFHFGLARMYEVFSSDLPVELVVFRDLDAANAWIVT